MTIEFATAQRDEWYAIMFDLLMDAEAVAEWAKWDIRVQNLRCGRPADHDMVATLAYLYNIAA